MRMKTDKRLSEKENDKFFYTVYTYVITKDDDICFIS